MPAGRPTDYTPEIAQKICEGIAEGRSLRVMCLEDDELPVERTVYRWLVRHDEFSQQYTRAKEAQATAWEEDILEIADNATDDVLFIAQSDSTGESGKPAINHNAIKRAQIQIDTRKWIMGNNASHKYAPRVRNEHTGKNGGPIETTSLTKEQRDAAVAAALNADR